MATAPSTRRAAAQPKHGAQRPRPTFTIIGGGAGRIRRSRWLLVAAMPVFTIIIVLYVNMTLYEGAVRLQAVQSAVATASAIHDEAILQQENLESPLRINEQVVHTARLVTPTEETQIARVSLDVPVRSIEVGPAPVHVVRQVPSPTKPASSGGASSTSSAPSGAMPNGSTATTAATSATTSGAGSAPRR
jgi:hypothetical protein